MRVVIITTFYKPSLGGVEYIVYHTARELIRHGLEVHIITTIYDNRWRRIAQPGMVIDEDIIIHRLEPSLIKVGYATIMKGLKEELLRIKPDIVHCHNLHPHIFQAIKWKEKLKYKLIAQLHYPIATGIDHLLAKVLYKFTMRELVKNQRKIDVFIAHTDIERQWLINEGIKKSRIRTIRYPCVPDELFNYKPTKNIHEELSADKIIINISRIHPRKGQHLIIEATKYLKQEIFDLKIYIAGPVIDIKYISKLKHLIEKYQLENYIDFEPNPLPEKKKLDAIATADIFGYTPIKDYSPVILLEALALKTPVVATRVGAIPEIIEHLGLKTLTNINSQDIAEKILKVLERKSEIALKGFNQIKRVHTNSILTQKLIYEVYINDRI